MKPIFKCPRCKVSLDRMAPELTTMDHEGDKEVGCYNCAAKVFLVVWEEKE